MKTTVSLLILFILVLGGGYLLERHTSSPPIPTKVSTSTSTPLTATSTTATPTQTPAPTKQTDGYTAAQVAEHNTYQSCWTSIEGNVYDLTNWIAQHPGGEAAILSICGKDGTQAFEGQHGRDPRPAAILATFKIGTLAS